MEKRRVVLNLILGLGGAAVIALLVDKIGLAELLSRVRAAGPAILLLLASPLAWFFMHALATRATLGAQNRANLGILRMTLLQAVSYGIAWAQPLQGIIGEPVKLLFLDPQRHDRDDFTASLVIDNSINFLANSLLTIAALITVVFIGDTHPALRTFSFITLGAILLVLASVFAMQQHGVFSSLLALLARIKPARRFAERNRAQGLQLDGRIRSFYRTRRADFFTSLGWHVAERAHGIFEFWLIFSFLGVEAPLLTCLLVFGIVNTLDNILFFLQIGGMEAYTALLLGSLGLAIDHINIAAPLFRRIRMLFWVIVALALWLPLRRRLRKGG